jgi:hypothetical protein
VVAGFTRSEDFSLGNRAFFRVDKTGTCRASA